MYKNQLQELAQRSCFNLPSYTCIREGPDHAPRFKASVNFNGEIFDAPAYSTTLRQAEHAAAEVALTTLSTRVPSRLLASKVLDEIGVYKNLLQESVHRAGLNLPVYTTERSGPGHLPVFISTVELAELSFSGEAAKTKKQAEKNAAMAAWSALRQLSNVGSGSSSTATSHTRDIEQEHVMVARVLSKFKPKGENRAPRRSNQNQVGRRMLPGFSSSRPFLHEHQQRRPGMSSPRPHNQQRGNFIAHQLITPNSLCPSNKGIQVQVRSKSQVRIQDVPPPLEEHQKDEDEWLYGRAERNEKSSTITKTPPTAFAVPSPTSRLLNNGIAQAVHIRSVIPVCAAPPPSPPPTNEKKQDISSEPSVTKQREQEVLLPEASSKLNDLHL